MPMRYGEHVMAAREQGRDGGWERSTRKRVERGSRRNLEPAPAERFRMDRHYVAQRALNLAGAEGTQVAASVAVAKGLTMPFPK